MQTPDDLEMDEVAFGRPRGIKRSRRLAPCLFLFCLTVGLLYPSGLPQEVCPLAIKFFPVWGHDPKIPNAQAFRAALQYFNTHRAMIRNRRFLTIVDYTRPSTSRRMYVHDLVTGDVQRYYVAHGKKSGDVYATSFSNRVDSLKSCNGFFLTGRKYTGTHGTSLELHGLQKGVNDNARKRGIVIHGARYVSASGARLLKPRTGRSWGCPAVSSGEVEEIVKRIMNGSLLYIHAGSSS
jgi:hypothetical protein